MLSCDEAVKEFLVESEENLDQLDREFVALEVDPTTAQQRIAVIFRTVHTIKGTSGFLGFSKLETLTHTGENLLAKLRDGVVVLTPAITSGLLALVDKVRGCLRSIEATGLEGPETHKELADLLTKLAGPAGGSQAEPAPATVVSAATRPAPPAPPAPSPPPPLAATPSPPPAAVHSQPTAPPPVELAPPSPPDDPRDPRDKVPLEIPQGSSISDTSVRVDVTLLDKLMNLVGELVLARNQILQFNTAVEDAAFVSASQRLNLITTELQEGVMKTRMQPIGNVWNKLPRVVRDLAMTCGKQVRIEMAGKETELDRTIIEAIKDPLTHIVRNAVDHGIESPESRAAAGKPKTGTLRLRAFHEGGQVNIEISDDGGGVNANVVRQKAIQNGIVSAERAARMTEREVFQLVFLPGFSTARMVTNVSGRGVGMDVVKTNVEKIGGTVDIHSRVGAGTTLKIKIPLTLAIVPALIVTTGGHRFAIPQASLLELVRLGGREAQRSIERINGAPLYRLRGNLLPLVDLAGALALPDPPRSSDDGDVATNIVVLQADDRQFGLVVDEIKDTEEIVVKPLGKELKTVAVFAGATIMGDGRVALILDVVGLAQRAGAMSSVREHALSDQRIARTAIRTDDKESLLLFRVGRDGRMAIPLSMVARLEEFSSDRLERAGRMRVVQYRGEILPLIELCEVLGSRVQTRSEPATQLPVVVYSENGRSVGLVVDGILDIVEDTIVMERGGSEHGIRGTAIIQGKVTELLDLDALIRGHDPSFFDRRAS